MKRLSLIIFLAAIMMTAAAQSNLIPEFKGISVSGDVEAFNNKLLASGFEKVTSGYYKDCYKGQLAGKEAFVYTTSTPKTKLITNCAVFLGKENDFSSYEYEVERLKRIYDAKYGEGELLESYDSPYEKGDGYEMSALRLEKLTYAVIYESIIISVSYEQGLVIYYINEINAKIAKQEEVATYSNDI